MQNFFQWFVSCRRRLALPLLFLICAAVLFHGCSAKDGISNPLPGAEDALPFEESHTYVESYIPEGYGLKVQRIADNQMILRLRDPNLRESYPGFLPGKEDQQYGMWSVNIGEHWSLHTTVYGSEHYAGYNENTMFSLSDSHFVTTSLTYNFDSYQERSGKRRATVSMPAPELYADGQELIYVLNIPDEVAMGFVEDYTYHVYIDNKLDGREEMFSVTEAEARTGENLLPEEIAAKKGAFPVSFLPLSSDQAFLCIDDADMRAKAGRPDEGQSASFRMDFALGDLTFVFHGEYQSDGALTVTRMERSDVSFSHTWLPESFPIGQSHYIPINQNVMEQEAERTGGQYARRDFLAMDDDLVQCDISISPPDGGPSYLPVDLLYDSRSLAPYAQIRDTRYAGMTYNEAYGILTGVPEYAAASDTLHARSGRQSLYFSGLTQREMDALYYTPTTGDVLEYKQVYQGYLDMQEVDTADPNVGMIYYRAWFDEQGNTVGYVEKFVFDTEIHPNNIAFFALGNDMDGGIFLYTAASMGYGKEEKDYSLVYRIANYHDIANDHMVKKRSIATKDGFVRRFGHLEPASTPVSTVERTHYKSEMDAKNANAPYFATYPQDDVFFKPSTADFVLAEEFGLEMQDTFDRELMMRYYGANTIQYDLARLRSFDEAGNEVGHVTRYVFEYSGDYYDPGPGGRWYQSGFYQSDARDCFLSLCQNRDDYEILAQVDNVVYVSQKKVDADARAKAELLAFFEAQGYKYYASKPLASPQGDAAAAFISTGKAAAYDYAQDFDLRFEAHGGNSATITLKGPFIKDAYTVNRLETPEGMMEYQWNISFLAKQGDRVEHLAAINTGWHNEYFEYQTQERGAALSPSKMETQFYTIETWQNYDAASGYVACSATDGAITWELKLPADTAIDFTQFSAEDLQVQFQSPYEVAYRLFYWR